MTKCSKTFDHSALNRRKFFKPTKQVYHYSFNIFKFWNFMLVPKMAAKMRPNILNMQTSRLTCLVVVSKIAEICVKLFFREFHFWVFTLQSKTVASNACKIIIFPLQPILGILWSHQNTCLCIFQHIYFLKFTLLSKISTKV